MADQLGWLKNLIGLGHRNYGRSLAANVTMRARRMTPPFPASGTPNSPFAGSSVNLGVRHLLPPGIAARVDITPDSVQRAAVNFATGQQHLADAWMRLQTGLNANAGMAGTGAPAKAFTSKYDPALQTIWKGFDSGIIHLGAVLQGLDPDRKQPPEGRSPLPCRQPKFRPRETAVRARLSKALSQWLNPVQPPARAGLGFQVL